MFTLEGLRAWHKKRGADCVAHGEGQECCIDLFLKEPEENEKRIFIVLARDRSVCEAYDNHDLAEQRCKDVEKTLGKYTVDLWNVPLNVVPGQLSTRDW